MRRISGGPVFARYAVFRRTSALNFHHSCRSLIAISFFLTLCRLTNANSSTTWLVGQPLEPGLGIAKDAFERVKRMLHPGTDAGLGRLFCSELVLLLAFSHLLEPAAFDGDVPTKLEDGRNLRLFNVIDDFNREALGIEVDFSLPSERVIRVLKQIISWRGKPQVIRCDNGPENISGTIQNWAKEWGIRFEYIQPGNPQQNAYVERFNRTVRYEWLSQYYWSSIEEVQDFATQWMWSYNHNRPHMALGGFTPKQHLAMAA